MERREVPLGQEGIWGFTRARARGAWQPELEIAKSSGLGIRSEAEGASAASGFRGNFGAGVQRPHLPPLPATCYPARFHMFTAALHRQKLSMYRTTRAQELDRLFAKSCSCPPNFLWWTSLAMTTTAKFDRCEATTKRFINKKPGVRAQLVALWVGSVSTSTSSSTAANQPRQVLRPDTRARKSELGEKGANSPRTSRAAIWRKAPLKSPRTLRWEIIARGQAGLFRAPRRAKTRSKNGDFSGLFFGLI